MGTERIRIRPLGVLRLKPVLPGSSDELADFL